MKLIAKGALAAAAAVTFVGMAALPAQAVGTTSQACAGGKAYGHSASSGSPSAYTRDDECKSAIYVRVQVRYNSSGGSSVKSGFTQGAYEVTYVSRPYPGYPVYQGDHEWSDRINGWQGPFSQ